MTPTSQQLARTVRAHALGVQDTPDPAGIFDDFHRMEVEALKAEVRCIRSLNAELEGEKRELRTRLQCASWLALLLGGLLFCALRWPGCGR